MLQETLLNVTLIFSNNMSHVMRNSVFGISEHKPGCTATEGGYLTLKLELSTTIPQPIAESAGVSAVLTFDEEETTAR